MFFLFLENCFLELHGICSMSATKQYQLIWKVIFHSVRSSALRRGVMTHPQWFIRYTRTTEVRGSNPTEIVVQYFF